MELVKAGPLWAKWTITEIKTHTNNLILQLHVKEVKILELWHLDTLAICDPRENKNREEIEKSTKERFLSSLRVDNETRFKVSLPWIQCNPRFPSYENIARRRIKTCLESLKKIGKLDVYNKVFEEWLDEKIGKKADPTNELGNEYYLFHKAVFKENSTIKVRPVFDGSAREKDSPQINDCIEKWPNPVELIPAILNRFRF